MSLFTHSLRAAVARAAAEKKPLFVDFTVQGTPHLDPAGVAEAASILHRHYVCLRLAAESAEYAQFCLLHPVAAPLFAVVCGGAVKTAPVSATESELVEFLRANAAAKPGAGTTPSAASAATEPATAPALAAKPAPAAVAGVQKNNLATIKRARQTEQQRLRALIEADRREVSSRNRASEPVAAVAPTSPTVAPTATGAASNGTCKISVRLLEGELVCASFAESDTLRDVKRWLQDEHMLLLVPEDNPTTSRYTKIGFPEPSRLAFYFPATRVTFSESQEFLRLADLGLCPRLALILKPDFDEVALAAAAAAEKNTWKLLRLRAATMLLALYSFFDYGVDDASRDFQDFSNEILQDIPHPVLSATASSGAIVVDPAKPKARAPEPDMDYSLVSSATRLCTPAPGGLRHILPDEMREEDKRP